MIYLFYEGYLENLSLDGFYNKKKYPDGMEVRCKKCQSLVFLKGQETSDDKFYTIICKKRKSNKHNEY